MLLGCVAARHRERVGAKDLHHHTAYDIWRPNDIADVPGANMASTGYCTRPFYVMDPSTTVLSRRPVPPEPVRCGPVRLTAHQGD
jgi:hypothetical protein